MNQANSGWASEAYGEIRMAADTAEEKIMADPDIRERIRKMRELGRLLDGFPSPENRA